MILQKGSNSKEVREIQLKLGLNGDGDFGPKTEEAVKSFQLKNGLIPNGIVNEETWVKITGKKLIKTEPTGTQGKLNLERLRGHIPDSVLAQLPDTVRRFKIDTPLEIAHFLAQCGHESGGFKVVQENLNYSADGLRKIFPKYFSGTLAESYARNPQKIASRAYGGRMGNGDETSGDGWKFRGRGYIQLTGKNNYAAFGKAINEDLVSNPDLVSTKYPLLSAAWFFSQNCLSRCTDSSKNTIESVTRCVNGGLIGINDRIKHFNEYYKLLS